MESVLSLMMPSKKSEGYLLVASTKEIYYSWACNLIEGIRDFHPEANICLVTEERFLDHKADEADKVIFCDDHVRAKLWGMANTPWDTTFYLDVDMEVMHEDISKVFDELGEADMVFAKLQREHWHIFAEVEFPGGTFELCGGVCLYRKSELVMQFMQEWYDKYVQQHNGDWWPINENGQFDYELYPKSLARWDQFTLWWLVNKEPKYKPLIVEGFKDNLRWNHWASLDVTDWPRDNAVLVHLSSRIERDLSKIKL